MKGNEISLMLDVLNIGIEKILRNAAKMIYEI
jgi:hypothetical protein